MALQASEVLEQYKQMRERFDLMFPKKDSWKKPGVFDEIPKMVLPDAVRLRDALDRHRSTLLADRDFSPLERRVAQFVSDYSWGLMVYGTVGIDTSTLSVVDSLRAGKSRPYTLDPRVNDLADLERLHKENTKEGWDYVPDHLFKNYRIKLDSDISIFPKD